MSKLQGIKSIIRYVGFLILLPLFSAVVNAAPPQTLDYQGYLANSGGVPLTGSVNVSISLYTAVNGGGALWTQTSSPTLSNGRFTVVLDGAGGNAFPAAVFDQPLFVGLTVDTDPEMTPRQPLTSVPSAFEAMNADTVDGMQANEIIDAASDEVRTPISNLPLNITTSGSYYLTQTLTATAGGIDLYVDNVTIDLMGFTLDGNGANDYGIDINGRSAVVIKNGTIREFGKGGVFNGSSLGDINVVTDVQVMANGSLGSSSLYAGIYLAGSSNRIERCVVKDSGGSGIYVGGNSIVKDNSAENSGGTYGILGGAGSTLTNNAAYNNQGTYGIYGNTGSTLTSNTAYNNAAYGIYGHTGTTLTNNTAYNNQGYGIWGGAGSTLTNNTAYNNQGSVGISGGSGSTLMNNTAYQNQGTGIYGNTGSTLTNNTAYYNQSWGIFAFGSNTVRGNTVSYNNQAQTTFRGGLRIVADSLVENNAADNNYETGIYVSGSDNILRHNHATDTVLANGFSRCIYFMSSDNAAIGNTATGCLNEFSGSLPPASRYIDNIGW